MVDQAVVVGQGDLHNGTDLNLEVTKGISTLKSSIYLLQCNTGSRFDASGGITLSLFHIQPVGEG